MKKTACFVLGVICTLPAYAGKIATVDYVHDVLGDAGFNVAPNSASVGKIANMEYLLKMVDMANNSRGLTSVYGQTSYATGHIADTNAVDTVIGKYLKNTCPVGSYWVDRNRTECKTCPTDFTSVVDTVGIDKCYISLPAGYMIKAGGEHGYYIHDCFTETERFCPGVVRLAWGTITSIGDMGVYNCPANSSTRSAQSESDWKYCTCDDGYSLDGTSSGGKKTQSAPCIKIEEEKTCPVGSYWVDSNRTECKTCPGDFTSDGGMNGITSCYIDLGKGQVAVYGMVLPGVLETFDCTTDNSVFNFAEGYKTGYYCPGGRFYYSTSSNVYGFTQCHPLFRHGTSMISSADECQYKLTDNRKYVDNGDVVCGVTSTADYFGQIMLGNCGSLEVGGHTATYGDVCGGREDGFLGMFTSTCTKDTATLKANCISGYGTWNDTTNKCTCTYPGTYELDSTTGKCKPKANTSVAQDCAARGTWNADIYTCTCNTGYKWNGAWCNDFECDSGEYFDRGANTCVICPDGFTSNGGMGGITSCYVDLEKGQVAGYGLVFPGMMQRFNCTTDDTIINFDSSYETGYYCPGGRFYYSASSIIYGFTQCHPLFRHGTSMISSADECQYMLSSTSGKYVYSADIVCGATDDDDSFGQITLGNCPNDMVGGYTTTYGDVCDGNEDGYLGGFSSSCY